MPSACDPMLMRSNRSLRQDSPAAEVRSLGKKHPVIAIAPPFADGFISFRNCYLKINATH